MTPIKTLSLLVAMVLCKLLFGQSFSAEERAEIQKKFIEISVRDYSELANRVLEMSDEEIIRLNIGVTGVDDEKKNFLKMLIEAELKNNSVPKIQYWRSEPTVNVTSDYNKAYTIRPGDTIDMNYGPEKNLALIKDGDSFILAQSYSTEEESESIVRSYGYTLKKYGLVGEQLKLIKTSKIEFTFEDKSRISINQLKRCDAGYLLVGPDLFILFNHDLEVIYKQAVKSKLNDRLFNDVDQLKSSENLVLFYGKSTTKPNAQNTYSLYSEIISFKNGKVLEGSTKKLTNINTTTSIKYPASACVYATSENEYTCTFPNGSSFFISKYSYTKKNVTNIWNHEYFNSYWTQQSRLNPSQNIIILHNTSPENIELNAQGVTQYKLDFSSNNLSQVKGSLAKVNRTEIPPYFHGLYPQQNKQTIITRLFQSEEGNKETNIIQLFDKEFNLVGQYRMALPEAMEVADFGHELMLNGETRRRQYSSRSPENRDFNFPTPTHKWSGRDWNGNKNSGYIFTQAPTNLREIASIRKESNDILSNEKYFFNYHNAFEYILDNDKIYVMTPFAFIRLDLKDIVNYTEYPNNKNSLIDKIFYQKL